MNGLFKVIALFTLLFGCRVYSLSQNTSELHLTSELKEMPYNLYDVIRATNRENPQDTTEGSHHKQLEKINLMWGSKLFPTGLTHDLGRGITEYVQKFVSEGFKNCNPQLWTELGPIGKPEKAFSSGGSGQIHAIRCSPQYLIDKTVYAASNWGGLWRKVGDTPWQMLNTDTQLPFTSVSDLAIDYQNTQTIYITTGDAEMSIGHHAQNHDGAPSKMTPLFTAGVWRSRDGGESWHPINGTAEQSLLNNFIDGGTIRKILIHPENPNILYINSSEGIFKTSQAKSNYPQWSQVLSTPNDKELKGLEFKPQKPSTIYASGTDIYISTNDGKRWKSMTGPKTGLDLFQLSDDFMVDRINIAVTEANPEVVYAYITGTMKENEARTPRLYIYKFDGKKWQEILVQTDKSNSKFITPTRTPIICSPTQEDNVCFGREILWGGTQITNKAVRLTGYNSGNIHADIHALAFIPGENKIWIGSDGGVHTKDLNFQNSTRGGEDISEGLAVKTIYKFDDSSDANDKILIGSQDTGTDVFKDGIWTFVDGGDGYNGKVDMKTGLAFYSMNMRLMAYNWGRKHNNENTLPKDPTTNETAMIRGTFDMKNHPLTEKMIFSMTELYERQHHNPAHVKESPDSLWSIRSDIGKFVQHQWRRQLTEFDISSSNPEFWMIALSGTQVQETQSLKKLIVAPKLFRAINGPCMGVEDFNTRACFEDITQNLINSGAVLKNYGYTEWEGQSLTPVMTSVLIHPENHLKAWVTFTGYQSNVKVWATNDGGDTWYNEDPHGSLNNLPVNDIVFQKGSLDRLYVATDAGIYTKDSQTQHWTKFCSFPNVIVTHLKINYCNRKLRASTFGRGLWEMDLLAESEPSLGNAEFIVNENTEWNMSRGIDKHIRISSGTTLRLTGNEKNPLIFSMPQYARIIIEPNAFLVLDNAHITNNCGKAWEGILVHSENSNSIQLVNKSSISSSLNGVSVLGPKNERLKIQELFSAMMKF